MRLKLVTLSLVITTLAVVFAAAHPLGNFSVNQYSRIEPGISQIKLHQVLDLAEIPTFQLMRDVDADGSGTVSDSELTAYAERITPEYAANLRLTINGELVSLSVISTDPNWGTGAGELPTLKITWVMVADLPAKGAGGRVVFQNLNHRDRAGWNEIVVNPASGTSVYDSSAYGNSTAEESRNTTASTAPLAERSAEFSFTPGTIPSDARPLSNRDGRPVSPVQTDTFAGLIAVPEITPLVALFGLLAAFGLGAVHAMSPGHGKTVVGAYLVGSRGTAKHAIFLGLVVTLTHTLGVFALGLVALFASNYILPERLMPFLGFVSGLLVLFIGITLFKARLAALYRGTAAGHTHGEHEHDGITHTHHGTTHSHGGVEHSHAMPEDVTWRSLAALGISGGLLPCPSALVLMLSAISLDRIGYGLVLTVVFSFGLAATLTAIGLAFLYVGKAFGNTSLAQTRVAKALPVFSAFVVTFLGAMICYNSLV